MASRIFVCFDGSDGAAHALTEAARLFPAAQATVAYAWQPPIPYGGLSYGGQIILPAEIMRELEGKARQRAEDLVEQAVADARAAHLDAHAAVYETTGPVWRQLLAAAVEAEAEVIVAGSRGFGEVKGLLLGSTSQALVHHSSRPVLIVPVHGED